MKIDDINEVLQKLESISPIPFTESVDSPDLATLARMFADKEYREMLVNVYNDSIKSSALRSNDIIEVAVNKGRALAFKELLVKGRKAFERLEEIRIKTLEQKS